MSTILNEATPLIITRSVQRFQNYLLFSTKQTLSSKSIEFIKAAFYCLIEVLSSPTEDIFVSQELIFSLSYYYRNESIEVNILLMEIINKLLTEAFFENLCDSSELSVLFLNSIMRIAYQSKHLLLFELLIRKAHKYLTYLLTQSTLSKSASVLSFLNELKESFPIVHSSYYQSMDSKLIEINLVQQCKEDKMMGLGIVKNLFSNITIFSEQYDLLINYSSLIIKPLIDFDKKKDAEVLFEVGKFLQKTIYMDKCIFDTALNDNEDIIPDENLILIRNNKISYDLKDFGFLNGKCYYASYEYEILQLYPKVINVFRSYIKVISDLELNFKLQFLCYQILKSLYFVFPSYRIEFEEYIPKTLQALSLFHNVNEWNQTLECREFAYYLLLHDSNLKNKLKSSTSAPLTDITCRNILLRDIDIPLGYMRKLTIDSGVIKTKDIEVFEKDSLIYIEASLIQDEDITIRIYKCDSNNEGELKEIAVAKKIKCFQKELRIIHHVNEPGRYRIDFDNSSSWITIISLHFRITILKPLLN